MSTRAIYEFYETERKIISVYIHHDGYPDGAAMHLNRVLKESEWYFKDSDYIYDFITRFVKENDGELTSGYDAHGDIEYIYKIDLPMQQITTLELNWNIIAEKTRKLRYELLKEEIFDVVEVCSIQEFLERHNKLLNYDPKKTI